MTFIWFSFSLDSASLLASVTQVIKLARGGDRFVVYEEEDRPVTNFFKLTLMGVEFKPRPSWRNLHGSKAVPEEVFKILMAEARDGSICKIDSDTLMLTDNWRQRFEAENLDLIGGRNGPGFLFGMFYIVRASLLERVLANIDEWTDQKFGESGRNVWPEDGTLSFEALKVSDKVTLIPEQSRLFGAWSHHPAETREGCAGMDILTFGSRNLLRGTGAEKRAFTAMAMAAYLDSTQEIPRIKWNGRIDKPNS